MEKIIWSKKKIKKIISMNNINSNDNDKNKFFFHHEWLYSEFYWRDYSGYPEIWVGLDA